MAVASMVLGIVSLITFCWFYIAIPCAIVSLILGTVSIKKQERGKGMAIAGIVTSAIALVIAIIVIILVIAGVAASEPYLSYYYNYSI